MEKKKILIIDDEPDLTNLLKRNLEETGQFEVQAENEALNGFAAAKVFKPDLILLDIIMPKMDGCDLAYEIKNDPQLKNIPIVFLTAVAQQGDISTGDVGISGYPFLAKPVTTEQIITCINETLA